MGTWGYKLVVLLLLTLSAYSPVWELAGYQLTQAGLSVDDLVT